MNKTVHVVITGRVQGVWYRGWTVDTASSLGLDGWVRNRDDGSVEAVFSGAQAAVEAMIEKCRRGPRLARVDHLEIQPNDQPVEPGFHQRPTG